MRYHDPEFQALMLTDLVPELLASLAPTAKADGPKLSVFSGHDACPILPVLAGVGVWDGTWPDYASMLIFELVSIDKMDGSGEEHFVRCMFKNGSSGPMKQRKMSCSRVGDGLCTWASFNAMLEKHRVNYDEACRQSSLSDSPVTENTPEACSAAFLKGDRNAFGAGNHSAETWRGL